MKKLLTLLLAIIMVMTACIGVSADSKGLFRGMNVLGDVMNHSEEEEVTRGEFAAVAATLMGHKDITSSATAFSDVSAEYPYGSAIRFVNEGKVMNGVNAYQFAPESTITVRDAIVALIRVLGFETMANSAGGYPDGYMNAATKLKAFNYVSAQHSAILTYGDMWDLIDWALETPVADRSYFMSNGILTEEIKLSKNNPSLMEKNLGLSMYEAVVNKVDVANYSINVTITDANEDSEYAIGETKDFKASTSVNIIAYDKTRVNIWVSDAGELMYITLMDNCEVIYGTVSGVNADEDEDSRYHTSAIEMINILDEEDEFEVSEEYGMSFFKNEESYSGYVTLVGSYVRMVLLEGEITAIETWDFKEGGIVTSLTAKALSLTRGRLVETMNSFDAFSKVVFILGGETRDIKDLKVGTLIDYWMSPDKNTIVILGSERVHTDIFECTVGADELQIGNVILKKAPIMYSSLDGVNYRENKEDDLLGFKVDAVIDAYGMIRYLTPSQDVGNGKFAGYVLGVSETSGLHPSITVRVVNLDDKSFPQGDYTLSKKFRSNDGINYNTILATIDKQTVESIYEFRVNSKNEIIEINLLTPYHGYSDGNNLVQQTINAGSSVPSTSIWSWNADNVKGERRRLFMQKSNRVVAIYNVEGETAFKNTDMNALGNTYANDAEIVTYYGDSLTSAFRLVTIHGKNMVEHGSAWGKFKVDFVTDVKSKIFDDGEVGKVITIGGNSFNIPSQYLNIKFNHDNGKGATYNDIKKGALVGYWDKSYFGEKNVVINTMYNLQISRNGPTA